MQAAAPTNTAPTLAALPSQTWTVGVPVNVNLASYGADAQGAITFTATGLPAGVSISATGLLTGTPTAVASSSATITVTDTGGLTAQQPLAYTVQAAAPTNTAPAITTQPTISGGTAIGDILTLARGAATGTPAPTATYQWLRGTTAISDATGATYTLVSGDVGQAISARVTWTNSAGSVQATSNAITVQAAPPVGTITAPVIVGNTVSGSTLSVDTGGTSLNGYNFNWQWNTDGGTATTRIGPPDGSPYAPLALDDSWVGRYVRCRYRIGTSGPWTVSGFVGPVTEADLSPQTSVAAPLDLYRQSAASPGIGWLGNVTAPLPSTAATMLTTYSIPEAVIHPCMVELPEPLLGFKYISAITAYPNTPVLEDPFVYGSNDRMNWTFLGNTPQPLDVKADLPGAYNSDTFITHDPATGDLIVGYRAYVPRDNTSSAAENSDVIIYIRRTKDGNTWTPREEIFRIQASVNIMLAPTVIYDPDSGIWHMWTIHRPNMHHWTAPSISGPWTQDTVTVSISAFNTPHHHEVKWVGNRLVCLLYSRGNGNLYFGVFDDGSWTNITWSLVGVVSPRPASIYKASFLPVWSPDNQSVAFDVWWTYGAAGPAGGIDNGLGRALQYARTNSVSVNATPTLGPPPVGTITAPVIVGNTVSGSTLSVDTGGTSLNGYNFNWQWNTDGGTATTRIGPPDGSPYAPLALDDSWVGRYVRCRYRIGTSGPWTVSGFVGPVTAVAPPPEP